MDRLLSVLLLCASGGVLVNGFLPMSSTTHWKPGTSQQHHLHRQQRGRPLYMIDNFFRLHETNRQLNWDEYFGKARYDLPQAFGTSTQPLTSSGAIKETVEAALLGALSQLPACAALDLALVSINSKDEAVVEGILAELSKALPGSTRVIGWAGSEGGMLSPNEDGGLTALKQDIGGISITLASLPAVQARGWYISEGQLRLWGAQGQQASGKMMDDGAGNKKWEHLVGVGLNQAYKDPPVFLLCGNVEDTASAQIALAGLDSTYPGTARVGGLASFGSNAILFSRDGGADKPQGGRILKEDGRGLVGISLVGDIRILSYVSQGAAQVKDPPTYPLLRVGAVSPDGKTILKVVPVQDGDSSMTPQEAGITENGLALGIGNKEPSDVAKKAREDEVEGADRWSLVSVRGSYQIASILSPGQWKLDASEGSLKLDRTVRPGQYLSWYRRDATAAADEEVKLVDALNKEIEDEWSKPELGVMKFRPTGTMIVKDPLYPGAGLEGSLGKALTLALPTAPLAGIEAAGAQMAPLDPEKTSALMGGSLVVNIFACKAKRRDLREIRYDTRPAERKGKKGALDLAFGDKPLLDEETGEVVVNRQAALIGTDVRVDNMAWNVREETIFATSLFESMVWTKERELNFLREDAPLMNLMRTVMMTVKNPDPAVQAKAAGLDVVGRLKAGGSTDWAVLGEVMRGTPFDGILEPMYDPVRASQAVIDNLKASAISVHVDQTYYGGKYQHVRDIKDKFRKAKVPVIVDDLVLYPYQLYLAKLFGADGVNIGLHVSSDEDLVYQVKICKSLRITPILTASSLHQLRRAASLSVNQSSIILIDDLDLATMTYHDGPHHRALDWLQDDQVKASLKERAEDTVSEGGPPLILVGGRNIDEAEKKELQAVGVGGIIVSYANLKRQKATAKAAAGKSTSSNSSVSA